MNARALEIIEAVAAVTGVTIGDMMGLGRTKTVARARHLACWVCRERTCLSYPELGEMFSRDNTTIIQARRRIDRRIRECDDWTFDTIQAVVVILDRRAA